MGRSGLLVRWLVAASLWLVAFSSASQEIKNVLSVPHKNKKRSLATSIEISKKIIIAE